MSFGFSPRRWEDCFEEQDLEIVRAFVAQMAPSVSWSQFLEGRPRGPGLNLWPDFCHYFDSFLARYGVVGPYDAVHLLPIGFGDQTATGARVERCVNLRPATKKAWFVIDAHWVHRSWPGHSDEAYAHLCRAYAKVFEAWMLELEPDSIDAAIASFEARSDAYETVTSFLEMRWVEAAQAACETDCPVALFW